MTLPRQLERIRLHLARSKDFPAGSVNHGYDSLLPSTRRRTSIRDSGMNTASTPRVRRFWNREDEQIGRLVHQPQSAEHARSVFDYDPSGTNDDEAGYRLGTHALCPAKCVDPWRGRGDAVFSGRVG